MKSALRWLVAMIRNSLIDNALRFAVFRLGAAALRSVAMFSGRGMMMTLHARAASAESTEHR